jgi:hypothetical protein
MVLMMAKHEAGPVTQQLLKGCTVFSQAQAKRDYQSRDHSTQMVLIIVRREAGPVAWWPKTLK